jgi:hypothetical protein
LETSSKIIYNSPRIFCHGKRKKKQRSKQINKARHTFFVKALFYFISFLFFFEIRIKLIQHLFFLYYFCCRCCLVSINQLTICRDLENQIDILCNNVPHAISVIRTICIWCDLSDVMSEFVKAMHQNINGYICIGD